MAWYNGVDERQDNQNVINQNFDAANEIYSWETAQEWSKYHYVTETQYIQQLNEQARNNYQNELSMKEWQNRENMRLYSYAKEAEAYNASVGSYYEQLDFNNIAEEMTIQDTARAYQDQLISIGFQNQDLLNKYYEGGKSAELNVENLTQKLVQAKGAAKLQIQETDINREFDLINATLDKAGLRDGLAASKAEAAFKAQGMRVELTEKEGQQKVLGQVGRSAEKAIQALLATHGNAQAALSQSITEAETKYNLDMQRVAETLRNKEKLTNLRYTNIAKSLLDTTQDLAASKKEVDLKIGGLKRSTDFGRVQLQQSLISAGEQNQADQLKIKMDKYQADLNSAAALKPLPKAPPKEKLPLAIPDTTYQKIMKPIARPLPKRGINVVHDTSFGDMLAGLAIDAAGAAVGSFGKAAGTDAWKAINKS